MWQTTRMTQQLNIKLPIIQAPMAGGATTPELIAAVSNAGGLGSLAAGYLPAQQIMEAIKNIRHLTDKPFAVNLFIPEPHQATPQQIETMQAIVTQVSSALNIKTSALEAPYVQPFDEQIAVIIEEKVPVFSFTFGCLAQHYIDALHANQTCLLGTATHLAEAYLLEQCGIDMIVAQGCEAGGHRGTFIGNTNDSLIGLMALLPQLVDHVNIPVIAAGGIMDARGMIAAHALGASGVQMGTAFLTCTESGIHPKYKEKLLKLEDDETILTRAFSGKMARGIKNQFITAMQPYDQEILDYPIQNALTSVMRKMAAQQDNIDFMSLWSGQAAYLCRAVSAADLLQSWINHINHFLSKK